MTDIFPVFDSPLRVLMSQFASAVPWLETHWWDHTMSYAMPPCCRGEVFELSDNRWSFFLQLPSQVIADRFDKPPPEANPGQVTAFEWKVLTFNTCSARPLGYRKLLATQFAKRGVMMAGLQETRVQQGGGVKKVADFFSVSSPCDAMGVFGVAWKSIRFVLVFCTFV